MTYIIEGEGALVNEAGEETPLKAVDFALVLPDEKHQYSKGDNSHGLNDRAAPDIPLIMPLLHVLLATMGRI